MAQCNLQLHHFLEFGTWNNMHTTIINIWCSHHMLHLQPINRFFCWYGKEGIKILHDVMNMQDSWCVCHASRQLPRSPSCWEQVEGYLGGMIFLLQPIPETPTSMTWGYIKIGIHHPNEHPLPTLMSSHPHSPPKGTQIWFGCATDMNVRGFSYST